MLRRGGVILGRVGIPATALVELVSAKSRDRSPVSSQSARKRQSALVTSPVGKRVKKPYPLSVVRVSRRSVTGVYDSPPFPSAQAEKVPRVHRTCRSSSSERCTNTASVSPSPIPKKEKSVASQAQAVAETHQKQIRKSQIPPSVTVRSMSRLAVRASPYFHRIQSKAGKRSGSSFACVRGSQEMLAC